MKLKLIVPIVAFLFLNACVKEQIPGPPGAPGKDANVSSIIFSIEPNEWNTSDPLRIYAVKSMPIITANIAEYGSVLVFYNSVSTNEWQLIPYSWPGGGLTETYWYKTGSIEISREAPVIQPSIPGQTEWYKIVVIESTNY